MICIKATVRGILALASLCSAAASAPPPATQPAGTRAVAAVANSSLIQPILPDAPAGNAALFVGVNEYGKTSGLQSLHFAVDDAILQAHVFVLELKLFPPGNCSLCLGGQPSSDAARAQLKELTAAGVKTATAARSAILTSFETAQNVPRDKTDLLLVSISSHGFEDGATAYAIPSDGFYRQLKATAIDLKELAVDMARSKAGKRLLFIDACRENAFVDTKGAGGEAMDLEFKTALEKAQGQALVASCDVGQMSYESAKLGHGVFTYHLVEALRGKATADTNGFITLGSVSACTAHEMADWTLRNEPGVKADSAPRSWFEGPQEARNIPLAIDTTVLARRNAVGAQVEQTLRGVKEKIDIDGPFTVELYKKLFDTLQNLDAADGGGIELLKQAGFFAEGRISATVFAPYLRDALGRRSKPLPATAVAPPIRPKEPTTLSPPDQNPSAPIQASARFSGSPQVVQWLMIAAANANETGASKALKTLAAVERAEPHNSSAAEIRRILHPSMKSKAAEWIGQAISIAQKSPDAASRNDMYFVIAVAQATAGDANIARHTADGINDRQERRAVYVEIARSQAFNGDVAGASATVEEIAESEKENACCKMAIARLQAGDLAGASSLADQLPSAASRLAIYGQYILPAKVKAGDLKGAKAIADGFPSASRSFAYAYIAGAQASIGDLQNAIVTADEVADGSKDLAFAQIAGVQADGGDVAAARTTALQITSRDTLAMTCACHIIPAQVKAGDVDGTKAAVGHLDAKWQDVAFKEIAITQADAGDIAGAKSTANALFGGARADTYSYIASTEARHGEWDDVREWAAFLIDPSERIAVLTGAANGLAKIR